MPERDALDWDSNRSSNSLIRKRLQTIVSNPLPLKSRRMSPSLVFQKLSNELYWQMAHWLGKKYDLSMPKVMQRFKADRSFGTKSRKLVRPDEYKAKKRLIKTWHNPYTEKEEVEREKDWIKRESLFTYDR